MGGPRGWWFKMTDQQYQWAIFWVDLDPVEGSEQAGRRPALVISTEAANRHLPVVTVLSITSMKPGRKIYPTEVLLTRERAGLSQDSILMAHQIRSVAKERLTSICGWIEDVQLRREIRETVSRYLEM